MKHYRTPIAAALCCMALASVGYAAGYGSDQPSSTTGSHASGMSGSGMSSSMDRETVRQVQQALADKGHNPGPIDGIMGPRTRAAVQAYQRSQNMAGARGLDSQTMESLGVHASATTGSGSMSSSGTSGTAGSTASSGSSMGSGTSASSGASPTTPGTARAPADSGGSSAGGSGSSSGGSGGAAK